MDRNQPYIRIVEQPAPKAIRFRYKCEGRSAGSIPGVNSTSDKKTYPTIQICGYTGRVIIVVSCVYKDPETRRGQFVYRPHPHNLVGRDRCKNGVCTVEVNGTNPEYTFNNLGIQCVKRRDIPEELRLREQIKVDPYKTGFSHKDQPQSIELNAVRLCFQAFLYEAGKLSAVLPPEVSEVVYDKKAMSDLNIARISHFSGPVTGGTEIILLCEKVNQPSDIALVFYEKENNKIVWEATANILLVYKQVAIVAHTPPYKNTQSQSHHKVEIQLKRVVDDTRSMSCPFTYTPQYTGTVRKPLPDLARFTLLLNDKAIDDNNNNNIVDDDRDNPFNTDSTDELSDESGTAPLPHNGHLAPDTPDESNDRSLNELLDQVAELDEIYSENRTRLENATVSPADDVVEDFDDAGTYTSLQLAFKNPIQIAEPETLPYEDVQVQTYRGPIIEFAPLKRDTEEERAPPLPPKRVRKAPSVEGFKTSQTSVDGLLKPGRQLPITRVTESNRADLTGARSEPALPPAPKKRSFFSRLFRRKEKSPAPSIKSEGKKERKAKPVGRSVSSVSGQRPSKFKSAVSHTSLKDNASGTGLSYADSITHISLHGDGSERSLLPVPLPPTDGGTILVAESVLALDANSFRKLQDELELTDAEHYALYMAVAPHATVSEFDETSCYYSPVEASPAKFQN